MLDIIRNNNLVQHTASMGLKLQTMLESTFSSHGQGKVHSLRGKGQGTFLAWDFVTPAVRDKFCGMMRRNGVQIGGCGEQSVSSQAWLSL